MRWMLLLTMNGRSNSNSFLTFDRHYIRAGGASRQVPAGVDCSLAWECNYEHFGSPPTVGGCHYFPPPSVNPASFRDPNWLCRCL